MTSTIKVNNVQNQCGQNIINENSNTITIGASGDTIALASGASQTGFGKTGSVDYITTPKTGDFTAVAGEGYFVNTAGGPVTVTLPGSPSAGDMVVVSDYNGSAGGNAITINRNGSNINGNASNLTIEIANSAIQLVFVDATTGFQNVATARTSDISSDFISATGGTVTTSGDFKIHTFTGPGTFAVSKIAVCAANNEVSHVVVGGGGGSGSKAPGGPGGTGAGGAGGYRESKSPVDSYTASPLEGGTAVTVTATSFPITVGAGGTGGAAPGNIGSNGVNSTFSTVTSAGGGGGSHSPSPAAGADGGSGGGGNGGNSTSGGSGNTPPVSPSQGSNGGPAGNGGGGGGGAAGVGSPGNTPAPNHGGPGGPGTTSGITGSIIARAGGGGGGGYGNPAGTAGNGGGGAGTTGPNAPVGANGTDNTGGGAGGTGGPSPGSALAGANGGSGIVIIRYKVQ
tara:strand:+ start:1373 stop:2737 length:1365 start_codon:yes stop_codon:yes gene_type:complete